MKKHFLWILLSPLCVSQVLFSSLSADDSFYDTFNHEDAYYYDDSIYEYCDENIFPLNKFMPSTISISPEYYHVKRTRHGGTEQKGNAYGVRLSYDYIKRYCFYVGGQAFYGSGILSGHTGSQDKIRSRLTDSQVEGYLGYTFQMKENPYFSFTPYGGYGYWKETNKFLSPSPLKVKYTTTFGYFAFGFLTKLYLNNQFSAGLNARFRLPYEPRSKISDDPEFEDVKQHIGNCFQYRIELPLEYNLQYACQFFEIGMTPFYEMRQYGARENFPFDFHRTVFNIWGANIQFTYRF